MENEAAEAVQSAGSTASAAEKVIVTASGGHGVGSSPITPTDVLYAQGASGSSLVAKHLPSKQRIASSNLVSRSGSMGP